jgi:ParB/RepB/Spo0J family partition protein
MQSDDQATFVDEDSPEQDRALACEMLPISEIDSDWARNPRQRPTSDDFAGLRDLMRARGMLQPVGVSRRAAPGAAGEQYDLVWGWRRLEAARLLGWARVPARIIVSGTETETAIDTMQENMERIDLTSYEVAKAIFALERKIKAETGKKPKGVELAKRMGISNQLVCRLQLCWARCPAHLRDAWAEGGNLAPVLRACMDAKKGDENPETRGPKPAPGPKVDKNTAKQWAIGIDLVQKTLRKRNAEMSSDYREGARWALRSILEPEEPQEETKNS